MRVYGGSDLRNVALVGHAQAGKTALLSAILKTAHMPLPNIQQDEDLHHGMTMTNAPAFAEWGGIKVNVIDTPGFHMFAHEARAAMLPAECAVVVVNAQRGIESVTGTVWTYAADLNLPRIIVIDQVDHPKADSRLGRAEMLDAMRERWGRQVVPVELPIIDAKGFHGVVDLVSMQAWFYQPDADGAGTKGPIPQAVAADAKAAHEALVELVAEGKDELMEEFFNVGTIPEEHLVSALHDAIREDRIFPVLYLSGLHNTGTDRLLEFIRTYVPAPGERAPFAAHNVPGAAEKSTTRTITDDAPPTVHVYKTIVDPFAGRISLFKVISGCVKNDASLENYIRGETERLCHLAVMQGSKAVEVPELHAGDLGAAVKLRVTQTGDTLGAKGHDAVIDPPRVPEPAMTYAIEPKTRADEDKLAPALNKLMEEDLMLRFYRDPQTNEFLVAGGGQLHIEAVVAKLKKRFHTEVVLKSPKVPYRETVRASAHGHGRHKKQSGGHGQFADCKVRFEPLPRGSGFQFASEIFGGSIPRQFVPAIEKGIQETASRGHLAGYPFVDFRAVVYDGSYHDVDSSEMAFKTAGRLAFRAAMEQARPALLEPVMRIEIEVPDAFAGAVIGDLNGRRGRVQGMEGAGGGMVVKCLAPLAEMLSYGTTLTSMTQGQGSFRMELDHYDFVPTPIAEKIAAGKRVKDEEEA